MEGPSVERNSISPGQESGPAGTTATIGGMNGTTGIAQVMQKERLVAALRPVPSIAGPQASLTLLSQLRPIALPAKSIWTHGFARLDGSGRVRDAALFAQLGWLAGASCVVSLDVGRLTVRSGEGTTLDGRGRLTLGETARRALHLDAGDGVLLSADLASGLLVINPAHRCDEVLSS